LQVGWLKTDTKAIQSIGQHKIVHNDRVNVAREGQRHMLVIANVTLEDAGPYMCQLNTEPMMFQVSKDNILALSSSTDRERDEMGLSHLFPPSRD